MAETDASSRRTEAVLHAQDYLQVFRTRWKEALLVFLLIFVCCATITMTMTPKYSSSMRFEIYMPRDLINVNEGDVNPVHQTVDATYMMTQFEALVSEKNLTEIVHSCDLVKVWGVSEQAAVSMLSQYIKVEPLRGTNIVDVTVTCTDAKQAQQICAAVAECYRSVREREEMMLISEVAEKRNALMHEREDEVTSLRIEFDKKSAHVYNSWQMTGGGATPQTLDSEEAIYQHSFEQVSALRKEIDQLTSHVAGLKDLKDDQLLDYVNRTGLLSAESFSSTEVRRLCEQYQTDEQSRSQMLISGYGEQHPKILAVDEQLRSTHARITDELKGMREAMNDQLDAKKSELALATERHADAKEKLGAKARMDRELQLALENYTTAKRRYDKLKSDVEADKMRMSVPRQYIKVYNKPAESMVQSSPNVRLNLIAGAIVGVVAGIVVAFVYNYFDTSVKTLEDAERHLGLPVLGVIPQDAGLLIKQGGNGPDAEAYRILRTNIELKKNLFKATTFAVVSSSAGEGKTTSLINLAYVFAQAGYSTLMIDADLRRPMLARYAEVEGNVGLLNYLTGEKELKDVVFRTEVPNLYLMPSGPLPSDPSGVLGSYRMENLLNEASKRFDIVFIDSPPVLGISDTSLLVSKADATLLVLQPRKMQLKALLRAKGVIQNAGGNIMGLVMNNVDISGDTQYQYYTTYYAYYTQGTKTVDATPKPSGAAKAAARSTSGAQAAAPAAASSPAVAARDKSQDDDLY